ncbi:Fungalysin metallopeptidase (M36) [Rhizoctonia solani]|uniref:Extracellular metalloproteinase n=1 Tax=Rhizoctonia solani TaxID=456999 RepID=A0A8H7I7G4_9AGAM|nr:Fungalysin metallopeptidase (M36) [Rhizoctonia solani]
MVSTDDTAVSLANSFQRKSTSLVGSRPLGLQVSPLALSPVMAPLAKLAAVALLISSGAIAAPWNPVVRHTTHHSRSVGPKGITASVYQPESTFETYGVTGVDHPLSKRATKASPKDAAQSFLESKLGVGADGLVRKTGHVDNRTRVANEYFRQQFNGIQVANAVANVAVKDDKIFSFGASFVKPKSVASAVPRFPKQNAIAKAEALTGAKYNSFPVGLNTLPRTIQVQNAATMEWYLVYVDAANGEVVNLVDFTAEASYRAIPFTSQDPRDGFEVLTDPDPISSPNGWHQYEFDDRGDFSIECDEQLQLCLQRRDCSTVSPNVDAARVNAFYVGNMIHDLTYRYGFTETSYNFQQNNNGLGGAQNDRVQISVQDSSGSNNAVFSTPPDGNQVKCACTSGRILRLKRWRARERCRHHEYGHGISNRLTGGGTATCLQTTESRGLGEGWSDALADWTEQKSATERPFTLGSYVYTRNIRTYPYSTDKSVNPRTYATLNGLTAVHSIGEVWALIWHEIYAALIAEHGFTTEKNNPDSTAGNVVALHLFIDGMKLQPCNPTFITARNAVIQADANRYNGANKCLLWRAYAKRGLGYGTTTTKVDSTTLPSDC